MTPLEQLAEHGQSIWFDYIRRGMTRDGGLARLVADDGVRGVTSNPAIFQKAIAGSDDYAEVLQTLVADPTLDAKQVYEQLAIEDITEACDVLLPVYESSQGGDGFVSLEVSPSLARHTEGTVAEAVRLWGSVARPNLMIKVPGTPEGIVAVEQLIARGINVNVTLIFAQSAYERIADAFIRGLEARAEAGGDVARVASVASFFVSRIDSEIDRRIEELVPTAEDPNIRGKLDSLRGRVAIANAKAAYAIYERTYATGRWKALADKGARPQRLLWASTGTKNPAYRDTLYVDELIGRDTVNTVPPQTLDAFRDHGRAAHTLVADVELAYGTLSRVEEVGISLDEVTDVLLEQGLVLFEDAMDGLLATIAALQRKTRGPRVLGHSGMLGNELSARVEAAGARWDRGDCTRRMWERDATLWTDAGEDRWLGWLDIVSAQREQPNVFKQVAADIKKGGFTHVLLLGMGGSSLCPDVLSRTHGKAVSAAAANKPGKGKAWPKLQILDSTVPAQVEASEHAIDLEKTLFVVASKSGTTLEPNALMHYFLGRAARVFPEQEVGARFVAITDPGSKLEAFANERGFRKIHHGVPEIGGRFSALSHFGMVPAAMMGIDVAAFLEEADRMVQACRPGAAALDNPGVALGLVLSEATLAGRDKLTTIATPAVASFGAWLEQLIAESTGKQGKAIIVVDGEELSSPAAYGDDRLFVYLRLRSAPDATQDLAVAALEEAGHPVVRIELDDLDALPQEFFRWQIATAVAGSVMQLNPFDQPDVEASKLATRAMTSAYEANRSLPAEDPLFREGAISLFADGRNADALAEHENLVGWLRAHLQRVQAGDYVAIVAYVEMNEQHERALGRSRTRIRDAKRVATCLGFGPRFLHSTGQAYKGGPNQGVFLQITCDHPRDLDIPEHRYGFEVIVRAQASGDLSVLAERGRRLLRVHLGADVAAGLKMLDHALEQALAGE
jgi:transaldolase / glucose-6-phosphate isomerase